MPIVQTRIKHYFIFFDFATKECATKEMIINENSKNNITEEEM